MKWVEIESLANVHENMFSPQLTHNLLSSSSSQTTHSTTATGIFTTTTAVTAADAVLAKMYAASVRE